MVRTHYVDVFVEIVKYSRNLHGSTKEDRLHHGFNLGGHLLRGNAVGSLMPPSRSPEDGPGSCGCQQFAIGTRCHCVIRGAFLEYTLHDRDDRAFEGQLSQLARAARSLGEIIADA